MRTIHRWSLIGLLVASTGCVSQGPRTIQPASFDYNRAIVGSWNEQLLLNIVRLRHRDTPFFLEVGSVASSYTFSASAGFDIANPVGSRSSSNGLGVDGLYVERPTITYAPLRGEEFARQLLVPTRLSTLFLLAQSGWSAEVVLDCCVERFGDLRNLPVLEGESAKDVAEELVRFRRAGELLQQLRREGQLQILVDPPTGELEFRVTEGAAAGAPVGELMRLLGLPESSDVFRLRSFFSERYEGDVGVLTRSVLSVLYHLSRAVDAPGGEASPSRFRVQTTPRRPADAFVSVEYLGRWYSIDRADEGSKEIFGLLSYLLAINSGDKDRSLEPVQTLTVN